MFESLIEGAMRLVAGVTESVNMIDEVVLLVRDHPPVVRVGLGKIVRGCCHPLARHVRVGVGGKTLIDYHVGSLGGAAARHEQDVQTC